MQWGKHSDELKNDDDHAAVNGFELNMKFVEAVFAFTSEIMTFMSFFKGASNKWHSAEYLPAMEHRICLCVPNTRPD